MVVSGFNFDFVDILVVKVTFRRKRNIIRVLKSNFIYFCQLLNVNTSRFLKRRRIDGHYSIIIYVRSCITGNNFLWIFFLIELYILLGLLNFGLKEKKK